MPEGQVLEFSGITKRFGAVTAVSDFSARVEPGVVTGFLGPNGAGKTTTLRMLLGLVRADKGTATIGGVPYASLKQPLQSVGAVLEASSFHPGRTAANHLKVYAQAAGLPASRVAETLGLVGLADVGGRKVGGFSLGMRQRLGLAYALLGDPGVLVLDEPANGLDPEGIKWMRGFLRRLAREGRTVFISSHLLAEVQQTVDSVLIIAQGRLVYEGSLEDLADPAEFATVVDSPDRAALSAALKDAGAPFELLRSGLTVRNLDPAAVGAVAASAGVALSSLQRRGPALEEVFLDLVSGARVHHTQRRQALSAAPAAAATGVATASAADTASDADPDADAASAAASADAANLAAPSAAAAVGTAMMGWSAPPDDQGPHEQAADAAADGARTSTYSVASTGVIDIIPAAGDPATDAYQNENDLDADPDVDALGEIDAELSSDEPEDGDAADGEPDGRDPEPADEQPIDHNGDAEHEPADADRPWETYVKTEADVEADAFFAAFTAEDEPDPTTDAEPEPPDDSASPDPAGADAHDVSADGTHDEGGEQR